MSFGGLQHLLHDADLVARAVIKNASILVDKGHQGIAHVVAQLGNRAYTLLKYTLLVGKVGVDQPRNLAKSVTVE